MKLCFFKKVTFLKTELHAMSALIRTSGPEKMDRNNKLEIVREVASFMNKKLKVWRNIIVIQFLTWLKLTEISTLSQHHMSSRHIWYIVTETIRVTGRVTKYAACLARKMSRRPSPKLLSWSRGSWSVEPAIMVVGTSRRLTSSK